MNDDFDIRFELNFGSNVDGADGMAFVFQTAGPYFLGGTGGGMGYQGIIPSLGIEFDTYHNVTSSDLIADHIAISRDGNTNHASPSNFAGPVQANPLQANVKDGNNHNVRVKWNATIQEITVYFDCQERLSYSGDIINEIFGGDPMVYWGLTASTGGLNNSHRVCISQNVMGLAKEVKTCGSGSSILVPHILDGTDYTWTPTTGLDDPNTMIPNASPTSNTTYIVSYLDDCFFPVSDTIHLNVDGFGVDISPDVEICEGEVANLFVDAPDAFEIFWEPHATLDDSDVLNPIATPTITTTYLVHTKFLSGDNLVINGDFESGDVGFSSDYYSVPAIGTLGGQGFYSVATSILNGWWVGCTDHTNGLGNMLIVDAASGTNAIPIGANVWCQTINVQPNTDYAFTTWMANLNGETPSTLGFYINGMQVGQPQATQAGSCNWEEFYVVWNSGANTIANICISEESGVVNGNDFALDDISFYEICEEINEVEVTVNYAPNATIGGTPEGCYGVDLPEVIFTGVGGEAPYTFTYTIDGGANQTISSLPNESTVILPISNLTPGVYLFQLVSVEGVNGSSCIQPQTGTVEILIDPLPIADFIIENGCVKADVPIQNTSSVSSENNANINQYEWDFGDGYQTSSQQNPIPSFNDEGLYDIRLIVTTNHGCKDTITQQIEIYPLPVVDFSANEVCLDFFTEFNNQSTINIGTGIAASFIENWTWNFADGNSSSLPNPTHTYGADGVYDVELMVESNHGCISSIVKPVIVYPKPIVSFTGTDISGCSPICPLIHSTSTVNQPSHIIDYTWNFGDGTSMSGSQISIEDCFYNNSSSTLWYDVELIVTTDKGCTDSHIENNFIEVFHNPVADFYYTPDTITVMNPEVNLINTSSKADYYQWTSSYQGFYQGGQTSPVVELPQTPGSYEFSLFAYTNEGCMDSISKVFRMLDEVIFYVPNTFTPDADHVNEIFKPTFSSGYNPYTYSLKIFNRWGELVFESFDVDVGWDGTFNTRNAVRVIDGTYIWTIEFKEMLTDKVHTYSGHVNVLK